jgi:hypothetical protein
MKGRHGQIGTKEVISDGAARVVRVLSAYRSGGCQVLACYSEDSEEGFTFVVATERPVIAVGDLGVIEWRSGQGRWEFRKGVG